jgi:hypothetical protein
MWSDRLERIATCMAELERIYADYKAAPEQAMFICIGEMDQLSELHRLLFDTFEEAKAARDERVATL